MFISINITIMKKTRKIILLITMIVFISIVSGQNNA